MRVLFITRGYPGLGRIMGSIALYEMLSAIYPNEFSAIFASYLSGYTYYRNLGLECVNLYPEKFYGRPNSFCNPYGIEGKIVQDIVSDFEPDIAVIDGEPLLIDLLSLILKVPVIVTTHPSDLHNPDVGDQAIELFRHYYTRAKLVIAHGVERLPNQLSCLEHNSGNVIQCNTLIRTAIATEGKRRQNQKQKSRTSYNVVGVLGGGSENVLSTFRSSTLTLAEWLINVSIEQKANSLKLFCADSNLYDCLKKYEDQLSFLTLYENQVDNIEALINADVIVGRSGRNLVSEMLALGTPSLMVTVKSELYRAADQYRTGEMASKLCPNCKWITIQDGFQEFRASFKELLNIHNSCPTWTPGNEWLHNNWKAINLKYEILSTTFGT